LLAHDVDRVFGMKGWQSACFVRRIKEFDQAVSKLGHCCRAERRSDAL